MTIDHALLMVFLPINNDICEAGRLATISAAQLYCSLAYSSDVIRLFLQKVVPREVEYK